VRFSVWVLAAMVLLGACTDGSDPGAVVEGTEIARSTTTTIPPAPHLESTSTVPVQLLPPIGITRPNSGSNSAPTSTVPSGAPSDRRLSWDGQHFDVGIIKKVGSTAAGWVLTFDREEVIDAHGSKSGPSLTTDPITTTGNPPKVRNGSRDISWFYVSADAPVSEYTPPCDGGPAGLGETVEDLATYGIGRNELDSLTFDGGGQVTAIQMTYPC
jgi:hypothetical protein